VPCCFGAAGAGQGEDPKQAICQASWERCLGTAGGKNWKPIYDRCLKARTTCLGGRAYLPQSANFSSAVLLEPAGGSGSDQANADSGDSGALLRKWRATRGPQRLRACGGGRRLWPELQPARSGVPISRTQRASSVVKCAGGKPAMFYPNGRIESCTLDNGGETARH
jgi:hypothetical protein